MPGIIPLFPLWRKFSRFLLQVLAEAIKNSKHCIEYTGAGISTAANIPDYRGPNGVWTRMEQGQPYLDPNASFDITTAQPTYTHMALLKLHEKG